MTSATSRISSRSSESASNAATSSARCRRSRSRRAAATRAVRTASDRLSPVASSSLRARTASSSSRTEIASAIDLLYHETSYRQVIAVQPRNPLSTGSSAPRPHEPVAASGQGPDRSVGTADPSRGNRLSVGDSTDIAWRDGLLVQATARLGLPIVLGTRVAQRGSRSNSRPWPSFRLRTPRHR